MHILNPNLNVSKLDYNQMAKRTIDEQHEAIRTIPAYNIEHTLELNAKEDSVTSVPRARKIQGSDGVVDCSDLRKICVFGQGTVQVGFDEASLVAISVSPGVVQEICALVIKVTDCVVVGRS